MSAALRGVALLALLLTAASAAAQEPGVGLPEATPIEQTLRPLTLPRLALRGDVGFVVAAPAVASADPRTAAEVGLGAGLGLTDDVELSVSVLPLGILPDVKYLNPFVAGTFRLFHDRTFQFALTAQVFVPVQSPFQGSASARLWIGLSRLFQLRTAITYTADVTTVGATSYASTLSATIDLVMQPLPQLYAVLGTGVFVPFRYDAVKTTGISLGAEVGVSVPGERGVPLADVFLSFAFPELIVPGADGDKVLGQPWIFLVGGRLFFTV